MIGWFSRANKHLADDMLNIDAEISLTKESHTTVGHAVKGIGSPASDDTVEGDMARLLVSKKGTDFVFVSSADVEFPMHSCILLASSELF